MMATARGLHNLPPLQERHQDYVLGPNQDSRLLSVAPGAVIHDIRLQLDSDAPFVLRSRAVRQTYTSSLTQANLAGLKSRWTGATRDYYNADFILESLQMAYYGQGGNPMPISPGVMYPANAVLSVDIWNTGGTTIPGLTFYFRGVKLFPWGAVQSYTYPVKDYRVSAQTFDYPVPVLALGVNELRQNQIFTCKDDADFVFGAGQGPTLFSTMGRNLGEIFITLKDSDKKPYSNDFVHFDIVFGCGGSAPATIPIGPAPSFVSPFGTGPAQAGCMYPEIYIPKNRQILYDLLRSDGASGSNQSEDFQFTLIGRKVFSV